MMNDRELVPDQGKEAAMDHAELLIWGNEIEDGRRKRH